MLAWSDLLAALGLAVALEGMLYALAPGAAKRLAEYTRTAAPDALRASGMVAVAIGTLVVWLARS